MPRPRELRSYQREAVEAVKRDWAEGFQRVGVVLPTGSGKSTVIGKLASEAYQAGDRVLLIAHRAELLDQMIRDTKAVDPMIPAQHFGIVRGVHDDHHAPIVAATFQTLARAHRREAVGRRDLIIVDETHHIVATGYHATFVDLGGYDHARMVGMTATMYRSNNDKGRTVQIGLGDVIQKISYERDLRWAIEQGFLVPPTGLTVRIGHLNALDAIKNVAGDFHQGDLAEVMEAAVEYTVDAVEMHARDRRSIIFAASVDAAEQITEQINERGNLRAATTIGSMSYDERQPIYQQFRDGQIDCLVTVMVLTEGADFPMCDCVVMARPTRSRVLYSQMVGRALRLYPGKTDALVLDLSGSTRQMKLVHLSELVHGMGIDIKDVDEDGEEILCPECGENIAACTCEPEEPEVRIKDVRQGPVDMTPIDLLADDDDTLWLRTPAGVHFIPLSDNWTVFVWPRGGKIDSGDYCVGSKNTKNGKGGWVDLDLKGNPNHYPMATALRKAEEWVIESGFTLPGRYAPWRTKNQAPTERQMSYAAGLNIPAYENMTRGRLSDEISIALVARVLDRFLEPGSAEADEDGDYEEMAS